MGDGFWVRATVALAHARWAQRATLPVSIVYRSAHDNYDDHSRADADGWAQYFEPINRQWPRSHLVGLSCAAAAIIFRLVGSQPGAHQSGAYAWHWSAAAEQRQWRSEVAAALPLRPLHAFVEEANAFWHAHGLLRPSGVAQAEAAAAAASLSSAMATNQSAPAAAPSLPAESMVADAPNERIMRHPRASWPVLGLHLRGTDRACSIEANQYLPLIRAYRCRHPGARLFVATDDQRMLELLQAAMDRETGSEEDVGTYTASSSSPSSTAAAAHKPSSSLVLTRREVLRGRSRKGRTTLNPAVHARGKYGTAPPHNASVAARLGREALVDTLLLSQCDFLLGSVSALTSYAVLLNPRLHERSFLWDLEGQPLPSWRGACST